MNGQATLSALRHLEPVGMSRESASVTAPAGAFIRGHESSLATLGGVDHDLRRPVVTAGAMTGLALNAREIGRSGGVTGQAGRRFVLDVQARAGTAMRGRFPEGVDGTMTELAAFGADEGRFADAQREKTREQDDPTGAGIMHPFLAIRLARENLVRQGHWVLSCRRSR